ncbi:MAG: UDP-N-acetylmuramoyl-tripeptide--D-alanyl-D-alanine ligase [Acidimicrobiaceae bacterium]|nr:UDP-N-acetylmuramoyl-tripeptide--D-alanyl-D-alanine ligase [Acidimicrobiaceae bacterium]
MRWTIADVAAATSGRRVAGNPEGELVAVAIDSRRVRRGELFVALRAERDGHQFVDHAAAAGAAAVLVDSRWLGDLAPAAGPAILRSGEGTGSVPALPDGLAVVEVADTGTALLALGKAARRRLLATVIGITGSVGKTSTKDLTAAALSRRWRTAASEKSFNNELGVPITLANAAEDTEVAVIEMGARGPGHIALLSDVARPGIAVVTAVAAVHTELFGSLSAIAAAKGELVEALPAGGTAVLNGDDPLVSAMADRATPGVDVLRFSASGDRSADVVAERVVVEDDLRPRFRLRCPWGAASVYLGVRGQHHVSNALAAASAALRCDVPLTDVVAALEEAHLSPWRMALERTPSGAVVLNDAYNANPASMEAAIRSLARLPAHRRVAVVGEMAELGDLAPEAHRRVVELADQLGVELLAVGTTLYGPRPVPDIDAALDALGGTAPLGPGTAVLVKASRVAGLERLAERLVHPAPAG